MRRSHAGAAFETELRPRRELGPAPCAGDYHPGAALHTELRVRRVVVPTRRTVHQTFSRGGGIRKPVDDSRAPKKWEGSRLMPTRSSFAAGRWRQGQGRCAHRLRRPLTPPPVLGVLATMAGKPSFLACKALHILIVTLTDATAFGREHPRRRQPEARGRLLTRDRREGKGEDSCREATAGNYASARKPNSITVLVNADAARPKRSPATIKSLKSKGPTTVGPFGVFGRL